MHRAITKEWKVQRILKYERLLSTKAKKVQKIIKYIGKLITNDHEEQKNLKHKRNNYQKSNTKDDKLQKIIIWYESENYKRTDES